MKINFLQTACTGTLGNLSLVYRRSFLTRGYIVALAYDFLLTFQDEVYIVWTLPLNTAAALYVIIRYGSLASAALWLVFDVGVGINRLTSKEYVSMADRMSGWLTLTLTIYCAAAQT